MPSGLDKFRFACVKNSEIAVSAVDVYNLAVKVSNNNVGNFARLCPFDLFNGTHLNIVSGSALPVHLNKRTAVIKRNIGLKGKNVFIAELLFGL